MKQEHSEPWGHLCTVETVAARLSRSVRTILRWATLGKIPSIKFGHSVLFDLDKVIQAIRLWEIHLEALQPPKAKPARKEKKANRDKRSPGEGEAERRKLPNRTQWVHWNPTRERLAIPRKRVLRRRQ